MQQLELLVAMRMRTRQERLHRLITGRASLLERWTTDGRGPPQYTDEELVKLAARDGILIESWRVASPLRARHMRACVCFCAAGRVSDHRAANLAPARTRPPSWRRPESFGVRTATSGRQGLEPRSG
jgi:hypothetical protein